MSLLCLQTCEQNAGGLRVLPPLASWAMNHRLDRPLRHVPIRFGPCVGRAGERIGDALARAVLAEAVGRLTGNGGVSV